MNIQPLADRVVVEPMEAEKITASGIVIPDSASSEKPSQGTVVAVGPGRVTDEGKKIDMLVKVGDVVLYSKYSPDEIKINGKDYLVVREDSILGIIK